MKERPEAAREQFEGAYIAEMVRLFGESIRAQAIRIVSWRREDGTHGDPMLRLAFWAWQESRKTVAVTNPFGCDPGDPESVWAHDKLNESLKAQGLKVKP